MNWTVAQWELFIIAADTLGTALLAVAMIYLRSIFATHRDHRALGLKVSEMDRRLSSGDGKFDLLEERIRQLPSAELSASARPFDGAARRRNPHALVAARR